MADSPALEPPLPAVGVRDWPDWPEFGLVNDLLPTLERWVRNGERFALATLIEVEGSSPRPLGSEMAISETGECVGYVSGGCVEAAVAEEALAVLKDGKPRLLDYGVGSAVVDIRLTCGGRIRILVRIPPQVDGYVAKRREACELRRPLLVATEISTGAMHLGPDAETATRNGWFFERHLPALRLILIGSDPVTLALTRLAPSFGLEVTLVRPNGPRAAPAGLSPASYLKGSIEDVLASLQFDEWTAIYTLTHDGDIDHHVLMRALRSNAFCVGALGSRRRATERRSRLLEAGIEPNELDRLHAPAGLWIGGITPQEIALSILGQIIAARPR